jgi:hypothetical protein
MCVLLIPNTRNYYTTLLHNCIPGTFAVAGTYSLKFAYHMYGSHVGTLQILALTGPSLQTASVVWERTGQGKTDSFLVNHDLGICVSLCDLRLNKLVLIKNSW